MITKQQILNCEVRALSWKQPYADLMLRGKQETRPRPTNYRGLVLICASKKPYNQEEVFNISGFDQEKRISDLYQEMEKRIKPGVSPYLLTGVATGIGRLINCRQMEEKDENATFVKFSPNLYVYEFTDVTEIVPFGWKGNQGWKILTDVEKSLLIISG